MKRLHLFEFTDQPWYPQTLRDIQTDYLQFVTTLGAGHRHLVPLFMKAMRHAETTEIVDLCSGGAGPWMQLREQLKQAGLSVTIKLTDKYPHPKSIQKYSQTMGAGLEYLPESVDAMNVPSHLQGMRTMFEGFHHFKPEQARLILQDAAEKKAAIGIFEASLKQPFGLILMLLAPLTTIVSYLFLTPLIKPRTLTRFFWTYGVPLVPLVTSWDGIVSMLRGYSLEELRKLTDVLECPNYRWEIGQASTDTPIFTFTYLLGYPLERSK